MKFIDSIQPPLALYGDVWLDKGKCYYWETGIVWDAEERCYCPSLTLERFDPMISWLETYTLRKRNEVVKELLEPEIDEPAKERVGSLILDIYPPTR